MRYKMGIVCNFDKQLFSSFAPRVSCSYKLVDSYQSKYCDNVAWVYAVADFDAPNLFIFIKTLPISVLKRKEDGFGFEGEARRQQLYQWHL